MKKQQVAFLGPLGTYSHLVARKRFASAQMAPMSGILGVCSYVSTNPGSLGVIPIENSSGGTINETVDILLNNNPEVYVIEELSLDVKLALLGHKGYPVKRILSHFAPLEHCSPWISKHLEGVEKQEAPSTAVAAERATTDLYAASLGSRNLARLFGLDILHFPVASETPNITTFVVISQKKQMLPGSTKTTLAIRLPNHAGSLYQFLGILYKEGINLSRLVSRPIRGVRQEYAFLVDIDGGSETPRVVRALQAASKECVSIRICGSYPCHKTYKS